MDLKRCKNGHYYDMSLSQACPHCAKQRSQHEIPHPQREERVEVRMRFVTDLEDETMPIRTALGGDGAPSEPDPPQRNRTPATQADTHANKAPAEDGQGTQDLHDVRKPVVGWLVCTSGLHYGKSFPLYAGKNTIGRGNAFSIPMLNDLSVSRTQHAVVVFDPKEDRFLVAPGEANELCYLNDAVVLTDTIMQKNDKLALGRTELMLIPCCDSAFHWEQEALSK